MAFNAALIVDEVDLEQVSDEYMGPTDFIGNVPIFRKDYTSWLEQLFGWPAGTVFQLYASNSALSRLAVEALREATGLVIVPEPALSHYAFGDARRYFERSWQINTELNLGWEFEDILAVYHNYQHLVSAAHRLLWTFVGRGEVELVSEAANYGINLTPEQARNMDDQTIADLWTRLKQWKREPTPVYRSSNSSKRSSRAPSYKSWEPSPVQFGPKRAASRSSGSRFSGSSRARSRNFRSERTGR